MLQFPGSWKYILILLLTTLVTTASGCSGSGSSEETGFKEVDFSKSYTLNADKYYSALANFSACGNIGGTGGGDCVAIYFTGEIDNEDYQGFAIKFGTDKMFVYTKDGTNFTVSRTSTDYSNTASTTSAVIEDDLGLKRIRFTGSVTLPDFGGATAIQSGDIIRGVSYSE